MLKNMKVKKSLLMGYGITIVVSTLIIIICLGMMGSQKAKYDSLMEREVRSNELVLKARVSANIAARNVRDILLLPDDPANPQMESRIHEMMEDLKNISAELEETYPENIDRNALSNYTAALNNWESVAVEILDLYNAGELEHAIREIQNTCTPSLADLAKQAQTLDSVTAKSVATKIAEINHTVTMARIAVAVALLVAAIAVIFMALKIVRSIVDPTAEVHEALLGFSRGELDIPVTYESKNELGEMCEALRRSQSILSSVIQDESHLLEEMANGNFALQLQDESLYVGALSTVRESIMQINHRLSDTLSQINMSAEQVSAGSDQVSTGAQALAQGATEQASAVEELSATIQEISGDAQMTAKRSDEALERANYTGDRVDESAKNMEEMVRAMGRISDSSQEISKIIATIENIAFQTNILALNAAVEAARAGSAGKGFAVVADEVRNLSAKSDQAAKATKELIDRSITSVQDGNTIVDMVSSSLQKTVEATNELKGSIVEIAKAIDHQAEAITQVTDGIEQISCVVQTNSATSEESAATSEELSSQASMMRNLMAQFKLRTTEQEFQSGAQVDSYNSSAQDEFAGSSGTAFSKY